MTQPKISVIVAVYNAGKYLTPAIQSVLNQTYGDFELLILDNGSKDGSLDKLYNICDPRIKIFPLEKNLGAYGGLNFLLDHCEGEYVAIQDHDDIWHPKKLSIQLNFLESHPEMVGCGTGMTMYYEADGKFFEYFLKTPNFYWLHPTLLFRRKSLIGNYEAEVDYMCDAFFQKKSLCQWRKLVANLPEILALHLIKGTHGNYSYKWFRLTKFHIKRLIDVHGVSFYTILAISFELLRKCAYPLLNVLRAFSLIAKIERLPFRLSAFEIYESDKAMGVSRELISRLPHVSR